MSSSLKGGFSGRGSEVILPEAVEAIRGEAEPD
jgi:hypothetical protein